MSSIKKYLLNNKKVNNSLKNVKLQNILWKTGIFYKNILGFWLDKIVLSQYELKIYVKPNNLVKILYFLQKHSYSLFKSLIDIIVVDYPGKQQRFRIIYSLLSYHYNTRMRLIIKSDELASIPSVVAVYNSANWSEREAWDLFGVIFSNHPDLRRILTDYGFDGHPLRKDFPLTGFLELFYDDSKKRIIYVPVVLNQLYKNYKFVNPWLKR